jgi:hypothetical protein
LSILLFLVVRILTRILCVTTFCNEIVLETFACCCFCFLRNGKSIVDPKGDFHKKIFNNNNNTEIWWSFFFSVYVSRLFRGWIKNEPFLFCFFQKQYRKKVFNFLYCYLNDIWNAWIMQASHWQTIYYCWWKNVFDLVTLF